MHNILIYGGRDLRDLDFVTEWLDHYLATMNPEDIIIIEGGALGADRMGREYAISRGIEFVTYEANWDDVETTDEPVQVSVRNGRAYNRLAGFNRNSRMLEVADAAIGFWDGKSKGTRDMSLKLEKAGVENVIVNY